MASYQQDSVVASQLLRASGLLVVMTMAPSPCSVVCPLPPCMASRVPTAVCRCRRAPHKSTGS